MYFSFFYLGQAITQLSLTQAKSAVYACRAKEYSTWESLIQMFPYCTVSESDERFFLQFILTTPVFDSKGQCSIQKIIGWAHPDLLHLLKGSKVHAFVDMTFKIVPIRGGFTQLMVIMVYCQAEDMYVPVFYILLQSKYETVYYLALQQVINCSEWKFEPKTFTCDFEIALINAIKTNWKDEAKAEIIGCYFHMKQAARRKLLKLNIDKDVISNLVDENGLFNILPLVPIDEIVRKGNCLF